MEKIKQIVENLEIPEKKEQLKESRRKMSLIKQQMSDLTIHQNVAQYVHDLDTIEYYKKFRENLTKAELASAQRELEAIEIRRKYLEADPFVQEYKGLFADFLDEKKSADVYYQTIQKDLRTELLDLELPNLFVYQGNISYGRKYKLARHIIIPNTVETFYQPEQVGTIIYPIKDMKAKRKLDHFYSLTSFRYLKQLTEDYSFDLDGKDLGPVNVLRRG